MTSPKDFAAELRRLICDTAPTVEPRRGPAKIGPEYKVIIGTSGSTDYLRDATGNQRFWPVTVPRGERAPDDGQTCDGLHDEDAPAQYLCSRCFPDLRGDLAESQEDEYDDARRDDDQEME